MTVALEDARVAVLYGGRSAEREVSMDSGSAVLDALGADGLCREAVGVEVLADGQWKARGRADAPVATLHALGELDLAFLALHGGEGEDGTLQGFLACAGLRHTGSGVGASAACMDKEVARRLVGDLGARVARARIATRASDLGALADEALGWGDAGVAVKPRRGGSSVATALVRDAAKLEGAVARVLETGDQALVEEVVTGVEVTAGVLEDSGGEPEGLPLVEIRPKPGRFFDYEEKYSSEGAEELCPPESLSKGTEAAVRELGRAIHVHLGLAGYSRSDFIVDADGPVYLETNALPGLAPRSLLPLAAARAGLDFPALCARIAAVALHR